MGSVERTGTGTDRGGGGSAGGLDGMERPPGLGPLGKCRGNPGSEQALLQGNSTRATEGGPGKGTAHGCALGKGRLVIGVGIAEHLVSDRSPATSQCTHGTGTDPCSLQGGFEGFPSGQ